MSETIPAPTATASASASASATLRFNGQPVACTASLNLSDLLTAQAVAPERVATAVNGQFVRRDQRSATVLQAGDEVMTFQAIVGG